jgi:hypothetical protein
MTNDKTVNLVAALTFVVIYGAIVASRPALRYFEPLLLTGPERFFSLIRRCSLRSDQHKVFLPFRFG